MRQAAGAELFGTFCLVFFGCGAIVVDQQSGALGSLGIAIVFGLSVMTMIYALGEISGAHINPAVSLAFWLAGRLPGRRLAIYLLAQLVGALLAAAVLRALFPAAADLGSTQPHAGWLPVLLLEALLSFILMFVILCVATGARETGIMAGAAIGAVVALEAAFAGPLSGASMNPARSLGPALVAGDIKTLWIYLLAPCSGMLLAVPFCRWVQPPGCCVEC